MKILLRSFFITLLSGLILLGGTGFTIGKMVCLCSGKTKIRFTPVSKCKVPEEKKSAQLSSNCCEVSNYSFQAGHYTSGSFLHTDQQQFAIPVIHTSTADISAPAFSGQYVFFPDRSPPPGGKTFRYLIRSLII